MTTLKRLERAAMRIKAKHPMQPIVWDKHGCLRFKENKLISSILECSTLDLNKQAVLPFSREDREQLAQLIGYSVSGFGDLSYVKKTTVAEADKIAASMSAAHAKGRKVR